VQKTDCERNLLGAPRRRKASSLISVPLFSCTLGKKRANFNRRWKKLGSFWSLWRLCYLFLPMMFCTLPPQGLTTRENRNFVPCCLRTCFSCTPTLSSMNEQLIVCCSTSYRLNGWNVLAALYTGTPIILGCPNTCRNVMLFHNQIWSGTEQSKWCVRAERGE